MFKPTDINHNDDLKNIMRVAAEVETLHRAYNIAWKWRYALSIATLLNSGVWPPGIGNQQ